MRGSSPSPLGSGVELRAEGNEPVIPAGEETMMRAFYRCGGNGSYIEIEDGRFADTVGGTTNLAGMNAAEAAEYLLSLDGDAVAEPWHAEGSAAEIEEYVGAAIPGDPRRGPGGRTY